MAISNHLSPLKSPDFNGDRNGDGKSDVVWRDLQSGEIDTWLLDGTQIICDSSIQI